jgi:SAM-dependent methyltransferase
VTWQEAGKAWGERARDWAYLLEGYGLAAQDRVLARTGVCLDTRVLDVACGSGLALLRARQRGADVSGVDASTELVAIAQARVPDGDIRAGDMFELPFDDESFDVVTSFNGIWAGSDGALTESRRVVRPGGLVAVTFWGNPSHMQLLGCFLAIAATAPPSEEGELRSLAEIGRPGVAEEMLERAGLTPIERGTVASISEWPDVDLATRALLSMGPAQPSIAHSGADAVTSALLEALEPFSDPDTGVRLVSEQGYVIARA